MDLNQVTLPALDVAASVAFYERLGLDLVVDTPDYARFACPDGTATLSVSRRERLPEGDGPVVYFECADLDARVAALREAGVAFEHGPRDEPWRWREARLHDPSGNRLCLYHAGRDRKDPPWSVEA